MFLDLTPSPPVIMDPASMRAILRASVQRRLKAAILQAQSARDAVIDALDDEVARKAFTDEELTEIGDCLDALGALSAQANLPLKSAPVLSPVKPAPLVVVDGAGS
jgi:hypothetical protein